MSTRKGGLGRGLGALIPTSEPVQLTKSVAGVEVEVANLKEVLISQISPIQLQFKAKLFVKL